MLLDRDGVLNLLVPRGPDGAGESPLEVGQVQLVPGAAAALGRLRAAGYTLAVVTNQPAAAKGEAGLPQIEAVQAEVVGRLKAAGAALDTVRVCLHHPRGRPGHPLSRICDCRKPEPGMLLSALAELEADPALSWMVGDADRDVEAGRAAGVATVLIDSVGGDHRRTGRPEPDARAVDLAAAVEVILAGRDGTAGDPAVRSDRPATTM